MVVKVNPTEDYGMKIPMYQLLGEKVSVIIKEVLAQEQINVHAISCRTKTVESFDNKIKLKKYTDPLSEVTDLCGVRIICYVEEDVEKVCDQIKKIFKIDNGRSVNKNFELGEDRVGYKSIHLIFQLGEERSALPEFKNLNSLFFEVQVRTILQHSWAEIEHDKNYKFSGVLPIELKRRLMLLSGTLELIDREFNQLSKEIDQYAQTVNEQTKTGELDIQIDSVSLSEYLSVKFSKLIQAGLLNENFNSTDKELLREMKAFNLTTLDDFDKIVPADFEDVLAKQIRVSYEDNSTNSWD